MPALVLFGRKWLIGSDDLVFPALFEVLIRICWLVLIGAVCNRYYKWTYSCVAGGPIVRLYLVGMLVLMSLIIMVLCALINRSAQGSIWDTQARKHVPFLLVLKMSLIIPEIGMNVLGSAWAFTDYIRCQSEDFTVTVIELVVLVNWALFALTVFGLVLLMDPVGSVPLNSTGNSRNPITGNGYPSPSPYVVSTPTETATDGTTTYDNETLRHRKVTRIWVRRFRWFFCWIMRDEHSREAFAQAAGLFSNLFRDTDIIPTDFIAGCILLRVKQKRESREQRRLALLAEQRYKCTSDLKELFDGKPSWMRLETASHYMKLSMSIYGWPFVFYTHCCTAIFKLLPKFLCCSCFRRKPTVVRGDNCCLCNLAGVQYMSKLRPKDILYASFRNHIFELPFCVMLDHKRKTVVVVIRGSMSVRDVFTDLTAAPEKFNLPHLPPDSLAHKGMLSSAKYIKKELEDNGVLERAFNALPQYKLVITGHSLGAGTSVLLALMLRPKYPDLRVYAFACPGGMVSRDIAKMTEEFTMTVGIGDDMIMRIGIDSVEDLRSNMLHVLHACRLPKYRIFLNGFGYAFFGVPSKDLESTWRADHRLRTPPVFSTKSARNSPLLLDTTQISDSAVITMPPADDYFFLRHNRTYREVFSRRFCKTRLYMPGNILHITRKKRTKEERKAARKLKVARGEEYEMRWASPEDFTEMRIMPRMLLDHLPENVLKTIESIVDYQETEIGLDTPQITII